MNLFKLEFDNLFSNLKNLFYIKDQLYKISSYKTYEIEMRFKFPKYYYTKFLYEDIVYDNIDEYQEYIYDDLENIKNGIKSKIRIREYNNKTEAIKKFKVTSYENKELGISSVLSCEINISNEQIIHVRRTCREQKIIKCKNYKKLINKTLIDIKKTYNETDDNNIRIEVEIYELDYDIIKEIIYYIISKTQNIEEPITIYQLDYIKNLLESNLLNGNKINILNRKFTNPRHITRKEYVSIIGIKRNMWNITLKLNGERRILCITPKGIFSINRSLKLFTVYGMLLPDFILSVLDTEYYNNVYYIFDGIICKGKEIYNLTLSERINICNELINDSILKSIKLLENTFKLKNYIKMTSIDIIDKLYNEILINNKYEYDGVVIVKEINDYFGIQYKIKPYNTYDLYFNNNKLYSSDNIEYNNFKINNILIKNNAIYEMYLNNNIYIPLKLREDKLEANSSYVIDKTNKSCITLEDIKQSGFTLMRKYHNYIKEKYLEMAANNINNPTLLDIGTGQGGDFSKWFYDNLYSQVFCVEPSIDSINEFKNRYSNNSNFNKCFLINSKISNYQEIINKIDKQIDVITIFFSYMMFSNEDIIGLLEVIKAKCNYKCVIVAIIMQNTYVLEKISKIGTTYINGYTLTKISNNKINITIPGSNILSHEEYLVNYDTLCKKLFKLGFITHVKGRRLFNDVPLPNNEEELSSMFTILEMRRGKIPWFVFKEIKCDNEERMKYVIKLNENTYEPIEINYKLSKYNCIIKDKFYNFNEMFIEYSMLRIFQ
jgi:hypothetical protein